MPVRALGTFLPVDMAANVSTYDTVSMPVRALGTFLLLREIRLWLIRKRFNAR